MQTIVPRISALIVVFLLSLSAAACAISSEVDPSYSFREGDVAKYKFQTGQKGRVTIDGETEEFNLRLTNTILQRVQKVDELGVATIDSTYENVLLTVDEQDLPLPDFFDTQVTYEVDSDGTIQNVRGTNGLAGPLGERQLDPGQIFQFQGPILREGVLKKGDKWQQTVDIAMPGVDTLLATIDYTYEGAERVKGKDAARIHFAFDSPVDIAFTELDEPVRVFGGEQIEGTAYFAIKEGKILKANGSGPLNLTMSMPAQGGGDEIERVKVEVAVEFDYELQE